MNGDGGIEGDEHKWFFEKEFFEDPKSLVEEDAKEKEQQPGGSSSSSPSADRKRKHAEKEVIEIPDDEEGEDEDEDGADEAEEAEDGTKEREEDRPSEDEDDEDEDEDENGEAEREPTKKGHFVCYVCHAELPNVQFSQRQRKKKAKIRRKCKRCMGAAVGKRKLAALSMPVSAAVLYKNNKDRFIGS